MVKICYMNGTYNRTMSYNQTVSYFGMEEVRHNTLLNTL